MKMFLAGLITALALAAVVGFGINQFDVTSAQFNSTDNVRL